MPEESKSSKQFDWKTILTPFLGVAITCMWGLISMHFAIKHLTETISSLKETVVELRSTVQYISTTANDLERRVSLLEYKITDISEQLHIDRTSPRGPILNDKN